MVLEKQLEFEFMKEIRAEEALQKKKDEKSKNKLICGVFGTVYGLVYGPIICQSYLQKHPEVIENIKNYISNIF